MKRRARNSKAADDIDRRYGLEPVIDVAAEGLAGAAATGFVSVTCPYCAEIFDTRVDMTEGSASYIEDCQVCCQPIEMSPVIDERGALVRFGTRRLDQ